MPKIQILITFKLNAVRENYLPCARRCHSSAGTNK